MSESKHTPGPWSLETVKTSMGICHKVGPFPWKNGQQNHACIYADFPSKGPIEEELLANARLIAAAPELLAAAQAAIAYDREIQACANDPDKMSSHCSAAGQTLDELYSDWLHKSRAAIAKAEAQS